MKNKKLREEPGNISHAHSTARAILSLIAIAYMTMLSTLTLFSIMGLSFTPQHANWFLNVVSLVFFVPALLALYLNRGKFWAIVSLIGLPIILLFSPMPSEPAIRFTIILAAAACFFLPGVKLRQKWLIGLPIGIIAFLLLITLPVWMFIFIVSQGNIDKIQTSMSPDRKHQLEVVGHEMGALSGSTRVNLYRNYPRSIIRRFERNLISRDDWPAKIEIKWIDNENIEIHGMRFNIGD